MVEAAVVTGLGLAPAELAERLGLAAPATAEGPLEVVRRPHEERLLGRPGVLLIAAARAALADADATGAGLGEAAFFAAVGASDPDLAELARTLASPVADTGADLEHFLAGGYRDLHPLWPLTALDNIPFCLACTELGVGGDNVVLTPSPDATLVALAEAAATIVEGRAMLALAGAAAPAAGPMAALRARLQGGTATATAGPPEDGAAVLVLEPADRTGRSAGPSVAGAASCCGEDGDGLRDAVRLALTRASVEATALDLVMASGCHDPHLAATAIAEGLGAPAGAVTILRAAAGAEGLGPTTAALDLALAVAVLTGRRRPPTVGDGRPPSRVLVAATGAGGQGAAVVLAAAR